jgi:hypothetical protein
MYGDTVEIWETPGELRCVSRPRGECWELPHALPLSASESN